MNHGSVIAAVLLLAPAAAAGDEPFSVRQPDLSVSRPAAERTARFGAAGSRWWTVGGGYANDLHQTGDFNLQGAYSYFLVNDVEFVLEANAWFLDQTGDDAFGFGPTMGFRWHFHNEDPWTVFADIGIGVLVATDSAPEGGTSFDFTPRAGFGFTRRLNDQGVRLLGGVRWHHISNARIYGDTSNPARDGVMFYTGIEWPF